MAGHGPISFRAISGFIGGQIGLHIKPATFRPVFRGLTRGEVFQHWWTFLEFREIYLHLKETTESGYYYTFEGRQIRVVAIDGELWVLDRDEGIEGRGRIESAQLIAWKRNQLRPPLTPSSQ